MKFLVKLIEVDETKDQDARDDLYANCTHVGNNYWLFEGETWALDDGIEFTLVKEEAIEAYGDLTGSEIKKMVIDTYNIDKCFLE